MKVRTSLCTAGAAAMFWALAAAAQSPNGLDVSATSASTNARCATGDTLLDNPVMRDLMRLVWAHSKADSQSLDRREQVGFLFDSSGVLVYRADLDNPRNTPCRSVCTVPIVGRPLAAVFTHPFRPGELLPDVCGPAGDTQLRRYDVSRFGGASELDLFALQHWGTPGYIVDKDNIYAIPRGATSENANDVVKRYPRVNREKGCGVL